MLYKRQLVLLSLLEAFDGYLRNTDFQKYLFLLSNELQDIEYHFIPYKYGCFSFLANYDKKTLTERGYLKPEDAWVLITKEHNYNAQLTHDKAELIRNIKIQYGHLCGDSLVQYVYKQYPYFAINSVIASKVLACDDLARVASCRPHKTGKAVCSISYEGKSLEEYLNLLIRHDIKLLCDVRKNPISRKYGFSKRTLEKALDGVGIEYTHIPKLGIESSKRQQLLTQSDYDDLFSEYEQTTLKANHESIDVLCGLLDTCQRIGVTCFEKSPKQCHRTRVVAAILRNRAETIELIEV